MSWGAKLSLVQLVKAATSCICYVPQIACCCVVPGTPAHMRDGLQSIQNRLKIDLKPQI